MFSWGEDCQRGFCLKGDPITDEGVHYLNFGQNVTDLSAGRSVLAFLKCNGNAFILHTFESKDGNRVRGKQKFVKFKEKIEGVSCEDDVVLLLSEKGSVFCVDTTQTPYTPRILDAFSNIPVAQVACGSQHSVALTKEGQVFTWGLDSRGQLGLGKRSSRVRSPQQVRSLLSVPVVQVSAGGDQSFALSVSGGVFGWGRNDCGQLGLGDTKDMYTPACVHSLNMKKTGDICCGKDHTVVLTKHGAVFTFGSGQYGQLGHNSLRNELRPRLVAELWGAKVIKIACGRYHTLVLTDSRKVYSFGCETQGQLGNREESNPSVPLPVRLPPVSDAPHSRIGTIFAGENCSFAACSSDEEVSMNSDTNTVSKATQHGLEVVVDNWTSKCDAKSWKKIKQEIHRTFLSASCLNKSFLEERKNKHFKTSSKYHGLNLKLARQHFKKLVKTEDVWIEVEAAVLHLLPLLDKNPVGVESLRIFLLLNELLHVIQKYRKQQRSKLAEVVATAVTSLSRESLKVLGEWWSSLSSSTMERFVSVWRKALCLILSNKDAPRSGGVRNLLQVLQYMYNVNSRVSESHRLPDSDFYVRIDQTFLYRELQIWRLKSKRRYVRDEPLVLCNFPIVMDLQTKKMVFDKNTYLTREEFWLTTFDQMMLEMFLGFEWCYPNNRLPIWKLDLNRASVLNDTFKLLAEADQKDYKRELVVFFDKHYEEGPVYLKDFFHEVFHELLSPESEMFMFNDSKTQAWFSSKASQEYQRFHLFGVLCGLALYNNVIIYLPFPLVMFKKLLGVRPSLDDLKEFSPSYANSLQSILDTEEEPEEMYFTIAWDGTEIDLDENPDKQVTSENKREFVDAFVNKVFNTSVEVEFDEFRRGFFQVCDRDLVKHFTPKELQDILVGKDFHDWEMLKRNTVYKGEYNADHPIIQMFWEVFDELTETQKNTFLWFVTGFERVPILGWDKIKMNINVKSTGHPVLDDQYYPATHTCFSTLELPPYSTKDIMQAKLTEALSNKRISQCV